jgi:hypothetical protein
MLKKLCPYPKTLVNHTLEQCNMLKKYYSRVVAKEDEAMFSNQRKRERHEVLTTERAPPYFLDLSEDAITFSCEDHPNCIPNTGQYPQVVDPSSATRSSPRY